MMKPLTPRFYSNQRSQQNRTRPAKTALHLLLQWILDLESQPLGPGKGAVPNTAVVLQALVYPTQGVAFPTGTVQFFGAQPLWVGWTPTGLGPLLDSLVRAVPHRVAVVGFDSKPQIEAEFTLT